MKELSIEKSDGERIRKAIIKHFEEIANRNEQSWINLEIPYILDWLEKQGEKIDAIETFDTEFEKQVSHLIASAINKEHKYNQGYVKWTAKALLNYAKHEIEWHREDEQNLNACLGYIPDEFLRRWLTDIIHVKYDKSADKVEPKFKNE